MLVTPGGSKDQARQIKRRSSCSEVGTQWVPGQDKVGFPFLLQGKGEFREPRGRKRALPCLGNSSMPCQRLVAMEPTLSQSFLGKNGGKIKAGRSGVAFLDLLAVLRAG